MSIIRAIKHRLGLSATPANNFVLDASADNGTMKLARESGQDIMTVDAAGKVAFPQNAQTWQDVKASRAFATDYTNNTGLPITVRVSGEGTVATSSAQLIPTVGGVALPKNMIYAVAANAGWMVTTQFVVPAGATYRVDAVQAALAPITAGWSELR